MLDAFAPATESLKVLGRFWYFVTCTNFETPVAYRMPLTHTAPPNVELQTHNQRWNKPTWTWILGWHFFKKRRTNAAGVPRFKASSTKLPASMFEKCVAQYGDRPCGLVVRVSGYRYRGPGFVSRRYQIFWVVVGLGRGCTQPREVNWGVTWIKK